MNVYLYNYRSNVSTTMNITEEEIQLFYDRGSHLENIMFSIYYTLIFIIAVPGNTLALWTFFHHNSTSPSDIFLRHLSVADIFYILILPMRIVYHLSHSHWPFGHVVCQIAGFIFYLNFYCSLYLMSFISLDRFLAVVLPVKSQAVRKTVYAKVAVALLWVLVIVFMTPTLFSEKHATTNSTGICNKLYLEKTLPRALMSTVVAFIIPLTIIVVSYILILLRLNTIKKKPVKDKAKIIILLVMSNFLFAFLPYHVSRVIYIRSHSHGHVTTASRALLGRVNRITSALTCVSALLDPMMYFFLHRAYREKLYQLLCKQRQEDQ